MTDDAVMEIPGRPQPKQRARTVVNKESGKVSTYTPPATVAYEQLIGLSWRGPRRMAGPLEVTIDVHEDTTQRVGDLDNYVKSVLDGLNGIAWIDDSQVVVIEAHIFRKRIDPHLRVHVAALREAVTA